MEPLVLDNIGKYGCIQDIPDYDLPVEAWSVVENIRFRNNYAEKFKGHDEPYGTPSVAPYFLIPVQGPTVQYWIYCGLTAVYVVQGTDHFDISDTAYGATANDGWNGGLINGLPFVNNGYDAPRYWSDISTATLLAILPAWPANTTARVMASFNNQLFAFDITDTGSRNPYEYRYSHAAESGTIPSSWDYNDATLLAGRDFLSEHGGYVKAAGTLGDQLIVYREWSTYAIRYVGGTFLYQHKKILNAKEGILGPHCWVEIPDDRHCVLTANDLRVHNGRSSYSVIENKLRDTLFDAIDTANKQRTFLVHNQKKNEVWVCFPEVGQSFATKALVWNYVEKTTGFRALPGLRYGAFDVVDATLSGVIDANTTIIDSNLDIIDQQFYDPSKGRLLMADASNTQILVMDETNTFNGTTFTAKLERTGLVFDDAEYIKKIYKIEPSIEAPSGTQITIKIGNAAAPEATVTWGTGQTFTVGTDYKVDFNNDANVGRFMGIQLTTTGDVSWRCHKLKVYYKLVGKK